MTMLKQIDNGILLCCGKAKCPVLNLESDDRLTITDDDGNTVNLDVDQAKLITQAIDQLQKDK